MANTPARTKRATSDIFVISNSWYITGIIYFCLHGLDYPNTYESITLILVQCCHNSYFKKYQSETGKEQMVNS